MVSPKFPCKVRALVRSEWDPEICNGDIWWTDMKLIIPSGHFLFCFCFCYKNQIYLIEKRGLGTNYNWKLLISLMNTLRLRELNCLFHGYTEN